MLFLLQTWRKLMNKELEILVEMQKLDDVITQKDSLVKSLPKELNGLKNDVKNAEEALNNLKEKLKENKSTQKAKELEIQVNKDKMNKYKEQLLLIKTNKEYKALNSEVNHLAKKNSGIDDENIALMEEEIELQNILAENKKIYEKADKELKENEDRLEKKIKSVKQDSENLRIERNKLAENLPLRIIKRYAALIKTKNRKAVVKKDGNSCSGCGYHLRPQLVIEIEEGKKILNCENCGRILVNK